MTTTFPPWQVHGTPNYDAIMQARCETLLSDIRRDSELRQTIIADPRALHRDIFQRFARSSHPEYAGTYRGTSGTSLAEREITAERQLEPGSNFEFVRPVEVPARMGTLLDEIKQLLEDSAADDTGRLVALTYAFCWFGKIHPFLDGNGHIQRALFAAMATEFGFPLSPRFAIHPRPYDRLLATALELFTCSPAGEENGEIGLVAEYLGFFLDGPFEGPRKNLLQASPYA
jgi:fido (protein-threonine AMPylation protein)